MISSAFADAIHLVCKDLETEVRNKAITRCDEYLWWELSCCILSSQVPYDLAVAFANEIRQKGLLTDHYHSGEAERRIYDLLMEGVDYGGRRRRYRFPKIKALQLSLAKQAITEGWGTLARLLAVMPDAALARRTLVSCAPGVGPKQASMFLRNSGVSFDLAIIDRHVINYVQLAGFESVRKIARIAALPIYSEVELDLRVHAERYGYKVGLLDWAIWIVSRVALKNRIEIRLPL